MRNRVLIENVKPQLEGGRYFIKRIVGEEVLVTADIFGDGHDAVRASLCFRESDKKRWEEVYMQAGQNDEWSARFIPEKTGFYEYKIEAWIDHLQNWHQGFIKKCDAGQHMAVELEIGAQLLEKVAAQLSKAKGDPLRKLGKKLVDSKGYSEGVRTVMSQDFAQLVQQHPLKQFITTSDPVFRLRVGRPKERFSAWYELFPRSASDTPGQHGTFKDCEKLLPRVAELGFDVLYFPPIHPIGRINRKGKNNAVNAQPDEPGSPWAIGSSEGGHRSILPALGTMDDFLALLKKAESHGLEIAIDLAFQCAPDHPYIKEHPDWFTWRPDGTIAYAENPPKKYQDIVPINFETEDWENLWNELKDVVLFWARKGVRIIRVDNPHTKPYRFWEWLIAEVQQDFPDMIFLAEAFSRPKVMAALGKAGFTQGYTYYTWRNSPQEMQEYLTELSQTEWREFFRPNFWPNTPDILPYELMGAGSNHFVFRLLMAATLSSNYGVYGPAYEMLDNRGDANGKEEYLNSEKYEIKHYKWNHRNRLTDAMTRINAIRRTNPALQDTYNIHFTRSDNDLLMSYIKISPDRKNIIWCVVNWDTQNTQAGFVEVPKALLGLEGKSVKLKVQDLLTNEVYHWFNEWNYVELDPAKWPIHILKVSL